LISGLVSRNVKAIPSGTPAAASPMNSGIELHEQNGVSAPRPAASR
jgi:hypothetical protein